MRRRRSTRSKLVLPVPAASEFVDLLEDVPGQADEELQVRWYREALGYLRERRIGYDVWAWRTVVEHADVTHALLRAEDKSPRPALAVISEINRREPGPRED